MTLSEVGRERSGNCKIFGGSLSPSYGILNIFVRVKKNEGKVLDLGRIRGCT